MVRVAGTAASVAASGGRTSHLREVRLPKASFVRGLHFQLQRVIGRELLPAHPLGHSCEIVDSSKLSLIQVQELVARQVFEVHHIAVSSLGRSATGF